MATAIPFIAAPFDEGAVMIVTEGENVIVLSLPSPRSSAPPSSEGGSALYKYFFNSSLIIHSFLSSHK